MKMIFNFINAESQQNEEHHSPLLQHCYYWSGLLEIPLLYRFENPHLKQGGYKFSHLSKAGSEMSIKLSGIPETLLILLWARAAESDRGDAISRDFVAREILIKFDYDFAKFNKARFSQLGVEICTMLLDLAVRQFVAENPDGVVANCGAGLDTRRARLAIKDSVLWNELDVPEAIELPRQFFTESLNYRFLAKSMFDISWFDNIEVTRSNLLIIAVGLFMYYDENELREMMTYIANRFPGTEMSIEIMGPWVVGGSNKNECVSKIENAPEFKWGIADTRDILSWHPRLRICEEWCNFDYHKKRAGLMGYFVRLPFIRPRINPRIVKLQIEDNYEHRE